MNRLSIRWALALPVAILLAAASAADEQATGRDKEVRDELVRLMDERQEESFRERFTISVPDVPTHLPRDYDLLFYGQHVGIALLRIEVDVRGNEAVMEAVYINEIRRGNVPVGEIDRLARQLAYAKRAITERKPTADRRGERISASHSPYRTYAITTRQAGNDFRLQTEANQLLGSTIREGSRGLTGFVETQGEKTLLELASKHLKRVEPDAAWRAEIPRRLKAVRTPRADAPTQALRNSLSAVEAQLYGALAVEWRLTDAIPDLRRLELATLADELAIATADDPRDLLRAALQGENFELFRWSLRYIKSDERFSRVDLLVEALSHAGEYQVVDILEALGDFDVSPAQLRHIEAFHTASKDKRARVAAAAFLLNHGRGDAYYDELRQMAARERSDPHHYDPEEYARDALFEYSIRTGERRSESAALARTLLDRIPAGARSDTTGLASLIGALGKLGERDDVARLNKYYGDDAYLASEVIGGIAYIDAAQALRMARRQIDKFNAERDPLDYGWYVGEYLDLVFWQRDVTATDALASALQKYQRGLPDRTSWVGSSESVLRYLRADTLAERVAAAKAYTDHVEPAWRIAVGKQLIADGADPKDVAPLVVPPEDATKTHR